MDHHLDPPHVGRDPLAWAADCRSHSQSVTEPEAKAAFVQLAEEFEAISAETEGLIDTVTALLKAAGSSPRAMS